MNKMILFGLLIPGMLLMLNCSQKNKCDSYIFPGMGYISDDLNPGTENISALLAYYDANPVYVSYSEYRAQVGVEAARELKYPGKIYKYANYLLVNELNRGIHVIDISNPANPQKLAFLNIPGNVDMAVKGGLLYADSFIDLIVFDLTVNNTFTFVKRLDAIFSYKTYRTESDFLFQSEYFGSVDRTRGILVDWDLIVDNYPYGGDSCDSDIQYLESANLPATSQNQGKAGSMARFNIYQNYLYAIDGMNFKVIDITVPSSPVVKTQVFTNREIETLFVAQQHLFIGSTTGMLVYDLLYPASPFYVSSLNHFQSCDPVIVSGNYAYVTLRSGLCAGTANQLDVIDISDLNSPLLLKSFLMNEPAGLVRDNNNLFVCDGAFGLKIFDATDPVNLNLTQTMSGFSAYDIIVFTNTGVVTGKNGLIIVDYTNPANVIEIARIAAYPTIEPSKIFY